MNKSLFKQPLFYTTVLSLSLLGLIISSYVFGWVTPTATPPAGNITLSSGALPSGSAGYVQFASSSTAFGGDAGLFWDNTNKRLGIGTTAPGAKLEVYGSTDPSGEAGTLMLRSSGNTAKKMILGWSDTADAGYIAPVYSGVAWKNLLLAPYGGNIGIGTTTPASPLTVAGVIQSTTGGFKFPDGTSQTTAASLTSNSSVLILKYYGTATDYPKRVFVSSATYNGNLGGLSGADSKCQTLANNAGLGGTWKAWLSSSTVNAKDRIKPGVYRVLTSSTVQYNDGNTYTLYPIITLMPFGSYSSLGSAINYNESGASVSDNVWTNTTALGVNVGTNTCTDWTSSLASVYVDAYGASGSISATWTYNYHTCGTGGTSPCPCNSSYRLYCFEQ